jgi:molybdenum-dependent DNA-binding transcriptional regulator ModE
MSAGAAAGGAACTSVGARSMRNYLKFSKTETEAAEAEDVSDAQK